MGACASISMTLWLRAAISISVQSCSAWPSASNHGAGHEIRSLRRPPLGSFDRRSADGYRAVAGRAMDHLPERTELPRRARSEEHTSELQSLMRRSYAVFCLKKKKLEII